MLVERGIRALAGRWELRGAPEGLHGGVLLLEVSPEGIVVADANPAKAGVVGERVRVACPDVDGNLQRREQEAS